MIDLMLAAQLVCGPGTAPGWLNETGHPTSCVRECAYTAKECDALDDFELPGVVSSSPLPSELELTGDDERWDPVLFLAGALVGAGIATVLVGAWHRRTE